MEAMITLLSLLSAAIILAFVGCCIWNARRPFASFPEPKGMRRFAILIPARNEAAVIAGLVRSLKAQDYPSECYGIYVLVNNSTDDTEAIARREGAEVMRITQPVSGKGDVLRLAFDALRARRDIDAYIIFDADNRADPHFLSEMNRAYECGSPIIQGRRIGKNGDASLVSGCYEIFYHIQNFLYNHAQYAAGNSCALNGTGWLIRREWLDAHGFATHTMTEDLELTALALAAGDRVAFAKDAITMDEYPTDMPTAWRQLSRWCYGQVECMRSYAVRMLSLFFRERSISGLNMNLVFVAPILLPVAAVLVCLLIAQWQRRGLLPPLGVWWAALALVVALAALFPITRYASRRFGGCPRCRPACVLLFPFFMLSWTPIMLASLFRRSCEWKPIPHGHAEEAHPSAKDPARGWNLSFLAVYGECTPSGLRSVGHYILLASTLAGIVVALNHTLILSFFRIRRLIRSTTLVMWALELLMILFKRKKEHTRDYGTWVPLYFCSIALYAGLLSSFGTGLVQRVGDVFLAVGGLCAGVCFLAYPSSSLLLYPWTHFCSLHSFLYHGWMIWLGVLINRSGLLQLRLSDFPLYMCFTLVFCLIAIAFNRRHGSNLMFISRPFNGTFLDRTHGFLKNAYTPTLVLVQLVVPFLSILIIKTFTGLLSRPLWYPPIT